MFTPFVQVVEDKIMIQQDVRHVSSYKKPFTKIKTPEIKNPENAICFGNMRVINPFKENDSNNLNLLQRLPFIYSGCAKLVLSSRN